MFDILFDLTRQRLQFSILITQLKTFSPSTVIVCSKFWRSWKKRELSKVWFFDWSYETKTVTFNFDIPAKNFLLKHSKCSFKNVKSLKKNQNFQKLYFYSKCSFGHVECSFNKQVENFPPNFRKSFCLYCFTSHANISERIQIDT